MHRLHEDHLDTLRDALAYARAVGEYGSGLTNVVIGVGESADHLEHIQIWIGFQTEEDAVRFKRFENEDMLT